MTQGLAANPGTVSVRKRRLRVFLMYILPPLIALFVVALPLLSTVTVMPRIRVSPGFALTDQRGEILTNEDLRGDIILFGLVSLSCDDGCLTMLTAMQQAANRIPADDQMDDAPGIRLVAIVVDAGNDPETCRVSRSNKAFREKNGRSSRGVRLVLKHLLRQDLKSIQAPCWTVVLSTRLPSF